jgi:hypothetical protein
LVSPQVSWLFFKARAKRPYLGRPRLRPARCKVSWSRWEQCSLARPPRSCGTEIFAKGSDKSLPRAISFCVLHFIYACSTVWKSGSLRFRGPAHRNRTIMCPSKVVYLKNGEVFRHRLLHRRSFRPPPLPQTPAMNFPPSLRSPYNLNFGSRWYKIRNL